MSRLVILLPPDADTPLAWLTVADDAVRARGTGDGWPRQEDATIRAMLVAPAGAVALHRALLPDLAARQAQAAARLMAVENALGDPEALHVASGPRDGDGALDVAVVANADMVAWLTWAEAHGLDAGPVVPAALLLPRPDEGFVRGRVGAETIARDKSAAFAVDPALAALVIDDAPVAEVSDGDIELALLAALGDPPLDLRQGPFARRKKRAIDWSLLKRLAVLVGLILLASLVMALVTIVKLNTDSDRLDTRALAAARTVVPDTSSVEQAQAALEARAASRGVGGRGFSATAARLFAALDQSPAAALTAFDVAADGGVRATIAAPSVNDLDVAVAALRSSGAGAVTTPAQIGDGRQAIQVTLGGTGGGTGGSAGGGNGGGTGGGGR